MHLYKTVPQYIALFLFICFTSFLALNWASPIYSQTVDELEEEINEKTEELNKQKTYLSAIEARIKEISGSNYSLSQKISMINDEISKLEKEIESREIEIDDKLAKIDEKQKLLNTKKDFLDEISAELYMKSRYSGEQLIFSFSTLDKMLQNLFVKKNAISILREDIEKINGEYSNLLEVKVALEEEKEDLDAQKKDLDDSYKLLAAEKSKIQAELNAQIATKNTVTRKINGLSTELSDLQYHLIIARQGGTHVDVNSVPASGEFNTTLAGFNANAPSGSFGVFSIGAYTHRNGMSQWGARARANAGQSYTQILTAYYGGKKLVTGKVLIDGVSENIMTNIKTTAYGTLNFESDYLLRLGEVPESWPMEVLKAQAIAARTYAVNYTKNGRNTICVTESCQVVLANKKTGAWKSAVEATAGVVLTDSAGKVFSTQYAAVHGGWINGVGWDTTDKSGSGNWMSRAYDSLSGVSWFYKSWYRYGYSDTSSSCSRTPWLSQVEMADIINVYQIWKANGGKEDSRIYPVKDACHANVGQYTHTEARSKAAKPVTSVSSVVVSSSNGTSNTVSFYTNAGLISMTGNEFKTIFNLRAPGHLRIPQVGFVHINIHKK